jgi:Smg protein
MSVVKLAACTFGKALGEEMKQTVLDVLLYLFEHCMDEQAEVGLDNESLHNELREAGFEDQEVSKALDWLQGLTDERDVSVASQAPATTAIRIYTAVELEKLDTESRGFLLFLEHVGVLDHASREMVIDRVMALESDEIDIERVKWVVLMVLFNQLGKEDSFTWMEGLVTDEFRGGLH